MIVFNLAVLILAVVGAGWLAYLVGKHGWAWVATRLKARALAAQAAIEAKAADVAGPLEARLQAIETEVRTATNSRVAAVEADIAALKAKAGI